MRVVSIPNGNIFARQPREYQERVLSSGTPVIFIEAASPLYWHQFLRGPGTVVGVESFGESAPGPQVYELLGVTAERILEEADRLLS